MCFMAVLQENVFHSVFGVHICLYVHVFVCEGVFMFECLCVSLYWGIPVCLYL